MKGTHNQSQRKSWGHESHFRNEPDSKKSFSHKAQNHILAFFPIFWNHIIESESALKNNMLYGKLYKFMASPRVISFQATVGVNIRKGLCADDNETASSASFEIILHGLRDPAHNSLSIIWKPITFEITHIFRFSPSTVICWKLFYERITIFSV